LACQAPNTWKIVVFFIPKVFTKLAQHGQNDALWGPARITAIINNVTTANI